MSERSTSELRPALNGMDYQGQLEGTDARWLGRKGAVRRRRFRPIGCRVASLPPSPSYSWDAYLVFLKRTVQHWRNKCWMFNQRLANVVNQFLHLVYKESG